MTSSSLTFVLGGARSGKSDFALEKARTLAGEKGRVLFLATAQAGDAEMAARIARHRRERPAHWQTVEAPHRVGQAWRATAQTTPPEVVVLDCITLLVANVLFAPGRAPETVDEEELEAAVMVEVEDLLAAHEELGGHLIVVSNEIGLGIVPATRLSRVYRDVLGRVNRRLARAADTVLFLVAGIPLDLTRLRA